jgi:hypothetical protein
MPVYVAILLIVWALVISGAVMLLAPGAVWAVLRGRWYDEPDEPPAPVLLLLPIRLVGVVVVLIGFGVFNGSLFRLLL